MPVLDTSDKARKALLLELTSSSNIAVPEATKAIKKFEDDIDVGFKKKIIWVVVAIFFISVITLWAGLWWIASREYDLINNKIISLDNRIITEKLLLALIAGTVTQVSLSFGLMMKFLFSKPMEKRE